MKRAHFFDIDTVLIADSKVWIIDKKRPNTPVMRLSQSDFNMFRSGIYRGQRNDIIIGGKKYWLSEELFEILKARCKKMNCDISNLSISMQEFLNREVIDTLDYGINMEILSNLKNSGDDIYFICSKNSKSNYDTIIKKIESKMKDIGLSVKKYYFISETFYSRNIDEISRNKVRLALQHLIGLKTESDGFSDEEIEKYEEAFLYDEDPAVIKLAIECNALLKILIENSDPSVKLRVKQAIKDERPALVACQVSPNRVNRISTTKAALEYSGAIKTFESFSSSRYPKILKIKN